MTFNKIAKNQQLIECLENCTIFSMEMKRAAIVRIKELIQQCDDLCNEIVTRDDEIARLEKQLSEKQPEWISVEDKPIPGEQSHIFTVLPKIIIKRNTITGEPAYWMRLDPPKPKEPTFKDKFLEAFPKAKIEEGLPKACVEDIFPWVKYPHCNGRNCDKCWNLPYFEEEKE